MQRRFFLPLAAPLVTLFSFFSLNLHTAADASEPGWSESFPSGDVMRVWGSSYFIGEIHAAVVFDEDGPGGAPAVLFAGGYFTLAGGLVANQIARWDGDRWSAVGLGLDGPVHALAVFDPDGAGAASPLLVVGGEFTTAGGQPAENIAAWDGSAWSALQAGVGGTGASVRALCAWDPDGPGMQDAVLVVGGQFDQAGGQAAGGLATWSGTSWAALGSGTTDTVHAIASFGSDLWVGGDFDQFDGLSIARLARFDGSVWTSGGTLIPAGGEVRALLPWDDGGGERLAIGGNFDLIDATVARNVAAFDGISFTALGAGLGTFSEFVEVLTAFDPDGTDETLWAGGDFGSGSMRCVARYDGVAWSGIGEFRIGSGGWVRALAPFDADGSGSGARRLWLGGYFYETDDVRTTVGACEWDGAKVVPLGNGLVLSFSYSGVRAASFDPDGAGPDPARLYVFGSNLAWAGEYRPGTARVAALNGSEWTDPGFTADAPVYGLTALDLGAGPELFATGSFTKIGGVSANRIAKWDGTTWSALGSGLNAVALDLEVWDSDGAGPDPAVLVAAGQHVTLAGGVPVDRVAQWDGNAWSDLGGGAFGHYGVSGLGVYDEDGGGLAPPKLFAVKNTSVVCDYDEWLLRFDGPGWTSFGTGYGFWIPDLETYDPDDTGPAPEQLYVPVTHPCFVIEDAPGQTLARWNGSFFQDMGFPHVAEPGPLATVDLDGPGPETEGLFAYNVTGENELSRYDGTSWSLIATSTQSAGTLFGPFSDLVEYDPDGLGPATPLLAALGSFRSLAAAATGDIVSSGGIGLYGYDPDVVTSVTIDLPVPAGTAAALTAGRAHPTPFRDVARLEFTLARDGIVRGAVYDVRGRRVRHLLEEFFPAGTHAIVWDGRNGEGRVTVDGVYFLRLEAHGESLARRVVRIE